MLMGFLRFFAAVFLLIAVLAAVYDGTRSMAANNLVTTPLIEHWSKLAPATLEASQKAVQRNTHPIVWELGLRKLLGLPAWLLFTTLGLLFAYAGRRRRRVNVFAN